MLYRLLLLVLVTLWLTACIGADDYETDIQGEVEVLPEPEPEPDNNILVNGGLEDSDIGDAEPTNWTVTISGDGSATSEVSADQYFDGNKSFKISIAAPSANPWEIEAGPSGILIDDAERSENDYVYTAWVLGTPGAIANFTASLPVDPWTTFGSQRIEVKSNWQKVSFRFSLPEGVTEIRLPVQLSQPENVGATIYIDAISLEPVLKTPPQIRSLPVDSGWRVGDDTNSLTYSDAGVTYSPNSGGDQLLYDLVGPENYHDKTFTFEIIADQAFIDSGANVQPFAQVKVGSWPGEWNCWINNGDLSVDGGTYTCTLNEIDANDTEVFDLLDGQEMQVGIQVVGSPAGTLTIASWSVNLEPLEPASDIPLDAGWNVSAGLEVSYGASGVSYSPTAEDHQLFYNLEGPDNLEGATFVIDITVSQDYINSGANLQPIAQQNFGSYVGEWSCWINNADLSVDGGQYSCTLNETGAPFNLGASQSIKFGVQAKGSPAGTVTITNVRIVYPGVAVDAGWTTTGSSEITYSDSGVSYSPTAEDQQFTANIVGPNNLANATFVFSMAVTQEFIDTGANLQPFAQLNFGAYDGHWSCWINNSDLSVSETDYSCTVSNVFNLVDDTQSMKVGVQPKGASVAGVVTISEVRIIYAD